MSWCFIKTAGGVGLCSRMSEDVGRHPMMRGRYFYSYWKYATQPIMRVFALRNSARP